MFSLVLKRSAALKVHRKTYLIKFNFSKVPISWPKAHYFAINEIFLIPVLPLLPDIVTIFTWKKRGIKREDYLAVFMHGVQLTEFSLGLSLSLADSKLVLLQFWNIIFLVAFTCFNLKWSDFCKLYISPKFVMYIWVWRKILWRIHFW